MKKIQVAVKKTKKIVKTIFNSIYIKIFVRICLIFAFTGLVAIVISYARGYRMDFTKRSLNPTGIISVNSIPKAAKIYINNELKGVTDSNITLSPGSYQVDIRKDGFTSWSKTIQLKGELVMSIDALLFPSNPSLSPLTNLGITKAIPLDQSDKIILFVENTVSNDGIEKDGIYLFEANRRPLNILSPLKLIVSKKLIPQHLQFISVEQHFSPDIEQGIFNFISTEGIISKYLFSLEEENKTLFDVTESEKKLLDAWELEKTKNQNKILETYPKEIIKTASDSFHIISFSPNETKILYQATKSILLLPGITPPLIATNQTKEERSLQTDHYYVYDKKEDKNYDITQFIPVLSDGQLDPSAHWYFDSKRIVLNEKKRISIMDYDGTNRQSVYSAPFENAFITTTTDGNFIILMNLNPEANKYPDLYVVGIK